MYFECTVCMFSVWCCSFLVCIYPLSRSGLPTGGIMFLACFVCAYMPLGRGVFWLARRQFLVVINTAWLFLLFFVGRLRMKRRPRWELSSVSNMRWSSPLPYFMNEKVLLVLACILSPSAVLLAHTHNPLMALCPGLPVWPGNRRNSHPLTPILMIRHRLSASFVYCDP